MSVLGIVTSFGTLGRNVRQLAVQIKPSEASLVSVMVIARGARRDRAVCSSRVRLPSPASTRGHGEAWRKRDRTHSRVRIPLGPPLRDVLRRLCANLSAKG